MRAITNSGERCAAFIAFSRVAAVVSLLSIAGAGTASAYVGDSFLNIPGVAGDWQGKAYKNWIRADANYWEINGGGMYSPRNNTFGRRQDFFSGPNAPEKGASTLVITVDKHSPALAGLMDQCANKTKFPELTYAESADRSRSARQLGSRPADIPEYYEYKLKDAQISDCPVVATAPDQAFVVSFNDIERLNYHGAPEGEAVVLEPSGVKPADYSSKTKAFVVSWIAPADDVSDDQCATLNAMPPEERYYELMSKEEADKARAENAKKGGVNYRDGTMDHRGPHMLNACLLPGSVPDPGNAVPRTNIARGLNLDGNDGTGKSSASTCAHKNYMSEDGRTGIDNQLYTVQGCIPGLQGHKGFLYQYVNEQRRNGNISILVQVSGIDNEKNDNSVDVTILYSLDHMAKDASGKQILPDYTFRLTDNPAYTHYARRLHGKIVDGVIITEPVKTLQMNLGIDAELTLVDAGMRLQIMPDGTLKGVVGGYEDWRRIMTGKSNSVAENQFNFECPAFYNALKRAADGMKDPVTGQCNGISSAYDIEGIPAFIAPEQQKISDKPSKHRQVAQADASSQKMP